MFDNINELSKFLGQKVPAWVVGTYSQDSIIMLDYKLWKDRGIGSFSQILTHELAHVIINQSTKQPCPTWINEGLAMYFAKQIDNIEANGDIWDFDDIYGVGFSNENIYIISAYMIDLIITRYGVDNVVFRLTTTSDFYTDDIFGKDNVNKLLLEIRDGSM